MTGSMKQEFTGVEAASMEEESHNPSVVQPQELAALGVQPQKVAMDKELLDQIAQTLKAQMSEFIKQIKALANAKDNQHALAVVPISMIREEDVGVSPDKVERKRGRKPNTKLFGELSISFVLPKNCIPNNIDLDKVRLLTQHGEETSAGNYAPKFSVIERLQNWNIEQRERSSTAKDVYYYHLRSQRRFRSKAEVVQFVLTETCPPKPGTGRKMRKLDEATISNRLIEAAVINQLVEVAVGNQDPCSTSSASTIRTEMSSHLKEIEIDKMMSTEEMLDEFNSSC